MGEGRLRSWNEFEEKMVTHCFLDKYSVKITTTRTKRRSGFLSGNLLPAQATLWPLRYLLFD